MNRLKTAMKDCKVQGRSERRKSARTTPIKQKVESGCFATENGISLCLFDIRDRDYSNIKIGLDRNIYKVVLFKPFNKPKFGGISKFSEQIEIAFIWHPEFAMQLKQI